MTFLARRLGWGCVGLVMLLHRLALAQENPLSSWQLQVNTRDFYLPGYRSTQVIEFERREITGQSGQVIGTSFEPVSANAPLTGSVKARAIALRETIDRLCLAAAKGPDGEADHWAEFGPDRLVMLLSTGKKRSRMTVYTGSTSYEGPEDQDPGSYQCILHDGAVVSWTFRSYDRANR